MAFPTGAHRIVVRAPPGTDLASRLRRSRLAPHDAGNPLQQLYVWQ